MRIRFTLGAVLAVMAALLLAFASPAMAKGGGGGGGGTTVPTAGCAQIVSAIVNPNPLPINPNPVYPEPIVVEVGAPPAGPAAALEVTVNNRCVDEVAAGPRGSVSVAFTTYDTATGARLFTGVYMQPAGAIMTWRFSGSIPAADATAPAHTEVVSVTRANGQLQDTLTYTDAAKLQATLTAVATGLPQSLR